MMSNAAHITNAPTATTALELSFVLPAHNEAMNIRAMVERLMAAGEQTATSFEILFVDDGSTDNTAQVLADVIAENPRVRVLSLSRNFGHMAALTAGLEHAAAFGAIITLDADGQHPPELIPEMVTKWRSGADIVQTIREATADETPVKRVTSRVFYKLMNTLSGLNLPDGAADYRLLDRRVADIVNAMPERERFVRGIVHWVGFRNVQIRYAAPPRMGGETKYNMRQMLMFALNAIVSFSTKPLTLIFLMGLATLGLAGLYAIYIFYQIATGGDIVKGWSSLILCILFFSGVQLLTLGVISQYVARLLHEVKSRPVYIVRDR